jgi:hypothetical protein
MKRKALISADNRFTDPLIHPLQFAEQDATSLAGFLEHRAGFDEVVSLLAADSQCILDTAAELVASLVPGDLFLFFSATHGTIVGPGLVLHTSRAKYNELAYLREVVPVDLLDRRTACPGVRRLFVLDVCRSHLLKARKTELPSFEGVAALALNIVAAPADPAHDEPAWPAVPLTNLCSRDKGCQALEHPTLRHGLFSLALLNTMSAALDCGEELAVSDTLKLRLRDRMGELAAHAKLPGGQRPWLQSNDEPPILLPRRTGYASPARALANPPAKPAAAKRVPATSDVARQPTESAAQAERVRQAEASLEALQTQVQHAEQASAELARRIEAWSGGAADAEPPPGRLEELYELAAKQRTQDLELEQLRSALAAAQTDLPRQRERWQAVQVQERQQAFMAGHARYAKLREDPRIPAAAKEQAWKKLCRSWEVQPVAGGELVWAEGRVKLLVGPCPMCSGKNEPAATFRCGLYGREKLCREHFDPVRDCCGECAQKLAAAERRQNLAYATKAEPWENTLGMKFVPVPGTELLFGIWDVRVKDYRAYAQVNSGVDRSWENPVDEAQKVTPREDCPVVCLSWDDAQAFCAWLTQHERAAGKLSLQQRYRLPQDWEWSVAVGLKEPKAGTPQEKSVRIADAYPWGTQWPPPKGAGNYADETLKRAIPVWPSSITAGYDDGYATTSPVGNLRERSWRAVT